MRFLPGSADDTAQRPERGRRYRRKGVLTALGDAAANEDNEDPAVH